MIFIDEIPQLHSFQHLNLTKSRTLLRGLLAAHPHTERLSRIEADSPTQLRELLNSGDTGIGAMRDILEKVLSRTHTVYTDPDEFDRFDEAPPDDEARVHSPAALRPKSGHLRRMLHPWGKF